MSVTVNEHPMYTKLHLCYRRTQATELCHPQWLSIWVNIAVLHLLLCSVWCLYMVVCVCGVHECVGVHTCM